jgi:hypothetical protein
LKKTVGETMQKVVKLLRLWLTTLLLPLIKLVSKIGAPEPACTYNDFLQIKVKIKPGDVLLSTEALRLSNWLIPGIWSHAAIYVGDNTVLEAVPKVVRTIRLEEFVLDKSKICLLRPSWLFQHHNFVNHYIGADYDFKFLGSWGSYYCSMLVYSYLNRCTSNAVPFPLKTKSVFGSPTIQPEDFYTDRDNFKVLYLKT